MPNLPSIPKLRLPGVRLPTLPDPVRGFLGVAGVAAVFFGPHAWLMAGAVTDVQPFGEVPMGQMPDFSQFTDGYGERDDVETDGAADGQGESEGVADECADDGDDELCDDA